MKFREKFFQQNGRKMLHQKLASHGQRKVKKKKKIQFEVQI